MQRGSYGPATVVSLAVSALAASWGIDWRFALVGAVLAIPVFALALDGGWERGPRDRS